MGGGGASGGGERDWELYECADFLAQQLGVSLEEAIDWLDKAARKRALAAARQLPGDALAAISLAEVQQLLDILSGVIGMPRAGMATVLRSWPRYLACQPAQARSVACFLREELGLTAKQAATLLRTRPQYLSLEVGLLKKRREALQRSLGLSDAQLARAGGSQSLLLGLNTIGIEQNASALLAWCGELGWAADEVAQMVSSRPSILTSSVATMQANLGRLMEVCSLSQQEAALVARSWPDVLYRSLDTSSTLSKLDFLEQVIGRPLAALGRALSYISLSLPNTIAPRTYFMRERGQRLSPTLRYLRSGLPDFCKQCRCTEVEFAEWVAAWRRRTGGSGAAKRLQQHSSVDGGDDRRVRHTECNSR